MMYDERLPAHTPETNLPAEAEALQRVMQPIVEALEKLAAMQKVQSDRLTALEREIRVNTPVTPVQVKYINAAMKDRAKALLLPFGAEGDRKKANRVTALIRKAMLVECGVGNMSEIPRCDYHAVMDNIGMWNSRMQVKKIAEEE